MSNATKVTNFMVKPTVLAESMTLTDSDSGKTYFLNSASGFTITLPSPRGGVNFEFIVKTQPTADYVITAGSKIIIGQVITNDVSVSVDPATEASGSTNIKFVVPDTRVGDSVKVISDGTYWYASVFCAYYSGVTIADQSKSPSASTSESPSASPSSSTSASSSISPSSS